MFWQIFRDTFSSHIYSALVLKFIVQQFSHSIIQKLEVFPYLPTIIKNCYIRNSTIKNSFCKEYFQRFSLEIATRWLAVEQISAESV